MEQTEGLRMGIIGIGNIGGAHTRWIADGKIPGMKLAALCDIDGDKRARLQAAHPDIPVFADYHTLLESGLIDAAIVSAPIMSTLSWPLTPLGQECMSSLKSRQGYIPAWCGR